MHLSDGGALAHFPAEAAGPVFYHRCRPDDAARAAARLRPQATRVYGEATSRSAGGFDRVRRFYVEGRDDRAVSPTFQRLMVERTPCEAVFSLDSDHSPFLSTPQELTRVLDQVATRLRSAAPAAVTP